MVSKVTPSDPQKLSSEELRRNIVLTLQKTPGEFTIYTIMAEEATKRIMPLIQSYASQQVLAALDKVKSKSENCLGELRGENIFNSKRDSIKAVPLSAIKQIEKEYKV